MTPHTHRGVSRPASSTRGWWRWPEWVAYAAVLWSLSYGTLGLYWMAGGSGFPFGGAADPAADASLLAGVSAATGAPAIAILGLVGATVAVAMAWTRLRGLPRVALLGAAWSAAVALAVLIPDYRLLVAVGYAPLFLLGAPFGWPPVSFTTAFPWPVINQAICTAGGIVWALTAVTFQRRTRDACIFCGRRDTLATWTSPDAAAHWGRWAVAIAVVVPLLYALTRWAWALGFPLGITQAFFRSGQASGMWLAGAGLATVGVVGAILTLGLIQPWGEVFPRWMIGLAGRRVPLALAILPASLVAVIVTSAGLMYLRLFLVAGFPPEGWATTAPEQLWPIWGLALGGATLAYYYRRRGVCTHCGRGEEGAR